MIVAVGDLQGCAGALRGLMTRVGTDIADEASIEWWFAGDLVNRGPASLAALRAVRGLGARAVTVLGNHDLHLLAVAAGVRRASRNDTLADILAAPDRDELLAWLRTRPLAHYAHGHLLVHAGVLPQWEVGQTLALAREVEAQLRGPRHAEFLADLYAAKGADEWQDTLRGAERARAIVNALTRLRLCDAHGRMALQYTDAPAGAPAGLMPWFDVPGRRSAGTPIVFGHWAALGLKLAPDLVGLDTGCVWGGRLTAVELQADWRRRRIWQYACEQVLAPGAD